MIRVLVVCPDRTTCDGIATALSAQDGMTARATVRSADEVAKAVAAGEEQVDAVVTCAQLAPEDVLTLARAFRDHEDAPELVVTGVPRTPATALRYLEAGADVALHEDISFSELIQALRRLRRGLSRLDDATTRLLVRRLHALASLLDASDVDPRGLSELTPREREVLGLVAKGLTNAEIGRRLQIAVGTVKSHVHSILKKLDVRDRDEARKVLALTQVAARKGWTPTVRVGAGTKGQEVAGAFPETTGGARLTDLPPRRRLPDE